MDVKKFDSENIKEAIYRQYGIRSPSLKELTLTGADFDGDIIPICMNNIFITEEELRKQFMEEKEMTCKITLIGSIKHNGEAMMEIYNRLTLRGHHVLLPYMDMIEKLYELHKDKMRESDFVIVVDQDGYIGKDTRAEITWCEKQGKRIIYASDLGMLEKTKPYKIQK